MIASRAEWTCLKCLRSPGAHLRDKSVVLAYERPFSTTLPLHESDGAAEDGAQAGTKDESKEEGAMSRRLSEMTEETMDTGGRSARKAMEEAGFSEELKKQLEDRIAQTVFRSKNQQALSQAEIPVRNCSICLPLY